MTNEVTGEKDFQEKVMGGLDLDDTIYLSLYTSYDVVMNQRELVCMREWESNPQFKQNFTMSAAHFCKPDTFDQLCSKIEHSKDNNE